MKVVSLWSGGKDSCLACYKAKLGGHEIISLLNFADFNGANSISHGLSAEIIQEQAITTCMPFFQKAMPRDNYEKEFKDLILKLDKKEGIQGIVFGDIYLEEHRNWIDKVCKETGVEAVMPLWGKDTPALLNEFIEAGFKAIIVSTRKEFLGREWLGRQIDNKLAKEFKEMGNIDPCGEKGEFHTFVYDGPIFSKPVEFIFGKKALKDNHWFLELIPSRKEAIKTF